MNLMLENNFLQRETKIFLVAFDAKGELKKCCIKLMIFRSKCAEFSSIHKSFVPFALILLHSWSRGISN